jgi:hypothetical protein
LCCSIFLWAYIVMMMVGFFWAPEVIMKYAEGFEHTTDYGPLLLAENYSAFPAVAIQKIEANGDDSQFMNDKYDIVVTTCEENEDTKTVLCTVTEPFVPCSQISNYKFQPGGGWTPEDNGIYYDILV